MAFNYRAPGTTRLANGSDFVDHIHKDTYGFINPEQFNLKEWAVLITGASKGIGRDTALSFARAGASKIAIAARSSLESVHREVMEAARKAGKAKPEVLPLQVDVGEYASVKAGADKVEKAFGRLDIIINNAGVLEPFVPLLDSDPKDWTRTYHVNVFGVYHTLHAFTPLLLRTSDGMKQVVNLSSIGAHNLTPGGSGYQGTKLAVTRLTEHLTVEYPELLAYSLHPGGVPTELAKGMGEAMMSKLIDSPRLAADTMVWLTSERREWLQGRYLSVTWDMQDLLAKREKIEKEDLLKVKLRVD